MNTDSISRYCENLWASRSAVTAAMDEIAAFARPDRRSGAGEAMGEGRDAIWDSTPEDAALTLASALHGMLTNPATDWLLLDIEGLSGEAAEGFVSAVNAAMLSVFADPSTGFQDEVNTFYLDLVCFGWAVFLCEMKDGRGIRFRAVPPSQCAIAENSDGRVDTVLRRCSMTSSQMRERFGQDALSRAARDALENDPARRFAVTHLVTPRENLPGSPGWRKNLPFVSIYLEEGRILRVGGFQELPCMVPRWGKRSGEVYGRGPGHACLPDMRVLNRVVFSQLVGAEKQADPPLLVADDSVVGKIRTHAGGITMYRAAGQQGDEIRQLPVQVNLDVAEIIAEKRRESIRAAFLNDRIQLAGGPAMTATEVVARERRQNLVLGPVLGRLESEFLGPLTDRVFCMLRRCGVFDAPPALAGAKLRARYVSPISRAQRQGEAQAFSAALAWLAPILEANPECMDNFNPDAAARDSRAVFGYPRGYLRGEDEVRALRALRMSRETGGNNGHDD
jgi:hypothetical protein